MGTLCCAVSALCPSRTLRAGHHLAAVRRGGHGARAHCARQLPAVASHRGLGVVAMQIALISAQVRSVPADILLIGTDIGPIALNIPAVLVDIRLVARDVALLAGPGALRRVVTPQVGPVRTDILTVPPDVTAVSADVRAVVGDVTLIARDVMPVGVHIRLCIIMVYVTMQVPLIPVDVAPVGAKVRSVPLNIPAVLVDLRLIARDVALLVLARALLGVFLPQRVFIGTQIRAIALDILTIPTNVRSVMRDVAPIARHIVTIVIAAGRLRRSLLIVGSGR